MSSDEEDEVVHELDVYLSTSLLGKLHLFQYPVQKSSEKYASDTRTGARIKPKNHKVEVEVAIDSGSPSYDISKGEQIALNVDGTSANSMPSTTYNSGVMDKQILQSTHIPIKGKRYVAGVVRNGEVHLTPVSSVLQLRPSFRYMDRAEQRASQAAKSKAASEADSSQDEAEEAKAVTFRIKGAETEAARLARDRSFASYEKRLAEEKWVTTKFHDKDNYAEREKQRLLCRNSRQQGCDDSQNDLSNFSGMVLTPGQYLSSLVPKYIEHKVDKDATADNVLSLSHLKNVALSDQLKLLMKNAKIIHFSHLLSLLPNLPDAETVVRTLQSYAVLVSGCWIVKSEVLYQPGTLSPVSGIPSESVCRARDYILYLFTKNKYVVRREVTSTVKIPNDEVRTVLEDIAVMRVGNGWELRCPPDGDFKARFPGVCQRQAMLWVAQYSKLEKIFNLSSGLSSDTDANTKTETLSQKKHKKSNPAPETSKTAQKPAPKRQRKTSGQKSSPVKVYNATKVVKIKTEQKDSSSLGQSSPIQLRSPPNFGSPNGGIVTTFLSPKQEKMQVGEVGQQVNIAGINSAVQQIAVKMQQMGNGSPNQATAVQQQYFIPQMNVSNASLNTGQHQENSTNYPPFNEQRIKIEKDAS